MAELLLLVFLSQAPTQLPPLELMYEEAMASMESARWGEAIEKLEAILVEEPSHIPTRFNLAISLSRSGETGRAIKVYRQTLERDETLFEARMNLAILLHQDGNQPLAVVEFARAAMLRPEDPVPTLYRARTLDELGKDTEAERAYLEVLEIAPNMTDVYRGMGFLYLRMDRPDDAYKALMKTLALGGQTPAVLVALGDMDVGAENLTSAKAHFELAAGMANDDADIKLRLALVLRDLEDYGSAIDLFRQLPDHQAELAEAYYASDRFAEAVPIYESLIVGNPDSADHWFQLGRSYYGMELRDEAIGPLQKSLTLDPTRVAAWGTLAAIHYRYEDWVNAGTMFLKYLELRPDHAPSHFALATCFDKLEDWDRALLHYNKFTELDDGSDDVRSFQVRQRVKALKKRLNKN